MGIQKLDSIPDLMAFGSKDFWMVLDEVMEIPS